MATADTKKTFKLRGSLVKDPTDLTAAFPHGGTALGLVGDFKIQIQPRAKAIVTAEEWGGVEVGSSYQADMVKLAGVLREFDKDAIQQCFANTVEGTVTQNRGIRETLTSSGLKPGEDTAAKAFKVLIAPEDPDHVPGFLLYNGDPHHKELTSINVGPTEAWGIQIGFLGLPDASFRIYAHEFLSDMDIS